MNGQSLVAVSRPEFIGSIDQEDNSETTLNTNNGTLPSDMFYYGLLLEVQGRVDKTNGLGTFTPSLDHVLDLVQEIRVEGFHRIRRQNEEFYNVSGTDAYWMAALYAGRFPSVQLGGVDLDADGDTDFRFFIPILFPPEALPLTQQGAYLLDAPNYDRLRLVVRWGDVTAVGTDAGGATTDLEAFNSATGVPQMRVHGIFATFGRQGAPGFVPGRVWRFTQSDNTVIRTTQNLARLFNISRGHLIRSLFLRTGTLRTGITANVTSFSRENMDLVNNIRVMRGTNKQIRHYIDHWSLREYDWWTKAFTQKMIAGVGFNNSLVDSPPLDNGDTETELGTLIAASQVRSAAFIEFAENHDIATVLDTTQLVQGPTGDVDLFLQADVISGAANQQARMVTQEIRGLPVGLRV